MAPAVAVLGKGRSAKCGHGSLSPPSLRPSPANRNEQSGCVRSSPAPACRLAGRTRDIFHSAAALGVPIERDRAPTRFRTTPSALAELFGLTDREADVASLLTDGLEIASVANELRISPETARTYLKYAFEKIGVKRQAELVALLARLRP
jgi:DNA-binding CsgD family transcriptional regulator